MSREINTSWECWACLAKNDCTVRKPSLTQSAVTVKKCKKCGSVFQIKFSKVPGQARVSYTCIKDDMTPEGHKIFLERKDKEEKKQPADSGQQP